MPNVFIRIIFFLSAYSPLWILIALQIMDNKTLPTWGAITGSGLLMSIAVLSTFILLIYLHWKRSAKKSLILNIKKIASLDDDPTTYIGSYMLPFLGPSYDKWTIIVAFIVTFLVLGILQVKSNKFMINPIMRLLGYHYFEIELTEDHTKKVRKVIMVGHWACVHADEKIKVVKLGEYSFLETMQAHQKRKC